MPTAGPGALPATSAVFRTTVTPEPGGLKLGVDEDLATTGRRAVRIHHAQRLFVGQDPRPAARAIRRSGPVRTVRRTARSAEGTAGRPAAPGTDREPLPSRRAAGRSGDLGRSSAPPPFRTDRNPAADDQARRRLLPSRAFPDVPAPAGTGDRTWLRGDSGRRSPSPATTIVPTPRGRRASLGTVVQTGNSQRVELDRGRRDHLVIIGGGAGESELLTEHLVMIIDDRQELVAEEATRSSGALPGSNPPK